MPPSGLLIFEPEIPPLGLLFKPKIPPSGQVPPGAVRPLCPPPPPRHYATGLEASVVCLVLVWLLLIRYSISNAPLKQTPQKRIAANYIDKKVQFWDVF